MKKVLAALALSAFAFGASASQLITKQEVDHFKLTHVGISKNSKPEKNPLLYKPFHSRTPGRH